MSDRPDSILISGAYKNNLKGISLRIPHNKLVVFAGISGSGKSSLVFDSIAAEASRQLNDTYPLYVRNHLPHYEPSDTEQIDHLTPTIVIQQRQFTGDIRSTVGTMTDCAPLLRLLFSRCASPRLPASSAYSFNDPQGMCPACSGLGKTVAFDPDRILDRSKSLNEGAILFPGHQVGTYQWQLYAHSGLYDPDKPLCEFTPQEWNDLLHGSGITVDITNKTGKIWGDSYKLTYEGLLDRITRLYLNRERNTQSAANQRILRTFTCENTCTVCHGTRINDAARRSLLHGYNIADVSDMEITELSFFLEQITDPIGKPLAQQLQRILRHIIDMGLGYLQLSRPSVTLSGGEAQRLKMIRHLGSSLTGLTYVFDEPSAGLHPKDVERLSRLLLRLRDRGNTILVVDHNRQILQMADEIIELGPGAGRNGGYLIFQGDTDALLQQDTPTAQSLCRPVTLNATPRVSDDFLHVTHARLHNLKDIHARFPLHAMTVVSGVAGCGKSSLICGELPHRFPDVHIISQAPIGLTSRSTPATYIGVMDEIRRAFARANHVSAALFSSNSKGACPICGGKGTIKTEMAFMDPIIMPCEACGGSRYSSEALQYTLHGKNILQVLRMTVEEAIDFFDQPQIQEKLSLLRRIGLGYLTLGQSTNTLSGGECQRIKLASHLQENGQIYVLDEPTTGLHAKDIALLLTLLDEMVCRGNTMILADHSTDVIAHADWVIDMGPGAGKNGGSILFQGPPSDLLQCKASITASYLQKDLTYTSVSR